ncbi:hypothetical protein G3570_12045 [Balneolaceae bacterium YR4-1]|uniref:SMP-30/Gluconolactonase/LRE-like region domain-containing protein n=1 Tax=Halalkalibaculum roseum TaxID=2709311 RepID=A0A6M1SWF2_9BACT|nr:hypothetical protein [Halalkalibaculum roseum]NGP77370.1 hypothetical protein [Halalkalibaculum roseum]
MMISKTFYTSFLAFFICIMPFGFACTEWGSSAPDAAVSDEALSIVKSTSPAPCQSPVTTPVLEFEDEGTAEGVAVSQQGNVFVGNAVSGKSEIWSAPKGDFDRAFLLADLPGGDLIGMDVDEIGNVYAAVAAHQNPEWHGLWKVQADGDSERVGALPAFFASLPNDVTIDPRGNVFVSDSFDGKIWRLSPDGEFSTWIQDDLLRAFFGNVEFGVNGVVYHNGALYTAITLNGRVIKIPIQPDGSAGTPTIFVQDDILIGIDGIEPDVHGNLYLTNNFGNTIHVIREEDHSIESISVEGLSAPASLAFNNNQKALYVANLSTSAGFPQPYAPALVKVKFSAPVVTCGSFN